MIGEYQTTFTQYQGQIMNGQGRSLHSAPALSGQRLSVIEFNSTLLTNLASYVPSLILDRTLADPSLITAPCLESFPAAVLFADISGFTTLTEVLGQSGPSGIEALTGALNAYFEQLIALIHSYGGDIVKFAGDALLAIWPTKESAPNHAHLSDLTFQVVECGIAIQNNLHNYQVTPDTILSLHVGIGAGEVFALHVGGVFGRWEFLIAGSPLAQMSNAESLSDSGEVVVSPEVYDLIADQLLQQNYQTRTLTNDYRLVFLADDATSLLTKNQLSITPNQLPITNYQLALEIEEQIATALRPYIPAAILAKLVAGQVDWLAELRRVTILFINLPNLDCNTPDALINVQSVMQKIQKAIYRYEGSINKLLMDDKGTTLIAVFGLPPLAHEDDAIRGVQAALDIHAELAIDHSIDGSVNHRPTSAIGLTTGKAFCGSVGSATRREYTTIGDVVNLAARLMKAAPNDILCDENTYQAARGRLRFEILPPILVKGKAEPVPIYRPQIGRFGENLIKNWEGEENSLTANPLSQLPTIGRTKERLLLSQQVMDLWRGGPGGIIVISGEAGIGKSRLVEDLRRLATSLGITSFVGPGNAIEKTTSYNAWRRIFSQLLDLEILWKPQDRQNHVLNLLELEDDLLPQAPLLNAILPLDLAENSFTLPLQGLERAKATRNLLLELMLHSAKRSAKVIIIEDAQWLDSASWALTLAASKYVKPILLVIATRPIAQDIPEYQELLADQRTYRLDLQPLSLPETATLIERRLGVHNLSEVVAKLVYEKAQGNPFFSEELAYALQEQGLLDTSDKIRRSLFREPTPTISNNYVSNSANWNFPENSAPVNLRLKNNTTLSNYQGDFSNISVPDTVEGVITSRIDRLTPNQQLVLKVASTIGRIFELQILYAIFPIASEPNELEDSLAVLEKLDIIHPLLHSGEKDLENTLSIANLVNPQVPVPSYIFKHVITQEVAYNLMPFAQRRQLHLAIAQWYENTYADDLAKFYTVLAHHWTLAVDGNFQQIIKAIDYLEKAGEQATQSFANSEATYFFQKALELLANLPENQDRRTIELRLQIALGLAVMAYKGWGAKEVETAYDRARELLNIHLPIIPLNSQTVNQQIPPVLSQSELSNLFVIMSGLWTFYQVRDQLDRAYSIAEQLLGVAFRGQNPNFILEANLILGSTLIWQGKFTAAYLHFEQVIDLYDKQQHHSHAFRYGRDPGIFGLSHSVWILWLLGYPAKAQETIQKAIALAEELADPFGMAACYVFAAELYQLCGNISACQVAVSRCISISQDKGFPLWEATGKILQGWVNAAQGKLDHNILNHGIETMRQGLIEYWETGAEIMQTYYLFLLASACGEAGQFEEGLSVLSTARETAEQTGECFWEAELYRLEGELLLQEQLHINQRSSITTNYEPLMRNHTPESCFQESLIIARRQGAKSLELRAAMSLAKLWQREGKFAEAEQLLSEVYSWFTENVDTADLIEARALFIENSTLI